MWKLEVLLLTRIQLTAVCEFSPKAIRMISYTAFVPWAIRFSILGSTTGILEPRVIRDGGAFIMKLDILWTKQFHGSSFMALVETKVTKCEVRAGSLFVAGHVPAGVLMEQDGLCTKARDNQDLLNMAMDPSNLEVN
jgi:hypothetical protein